MKIIKGLLMIVGVVAILLFGLEMAFPHLITGYAGTPKNASYQFALNNLNKSGAQVGEAKTNDTDLPQGAKLIRKIEAGNGDYSTNSKIYELNGRYYLQTNLLANKGKSLIDPKTTINLGKESDYKEYSYQVNELAKGAKKVWTTEVPKAQAYADKFMSTTTGKNIKTAVSKVGQVIMDGSRQVYGDLDETFGGKLSEVLGNGAKWVNDTLGGWVNGLGGK